MPFHNLQQLSDAVDSLLSAGQKDSENAAAFLISTVQPLSDRVAALEKTVADLSATVKALKG